MKPTHKGVEVEAFEYGIDKLPKWAKGKVRRDSWDFMCLFYETKKIKKYARQMEAMEEGVFMCCIGDMVLRTKAGDIHVLRKTTFNSLYKAETIEGAKV